MKTVADLEDTDLALMATKLQLPMIVSDFVSGKKPLTGDSCYALHDLISEMKPDHALLAMALAGMVICGAAKTKSSVRGVLHAECDQMIAEYAPAFLENGKVCRFVSAGDSRLALECVAEDLETLGDLFLTLARMTEGRDPVCSALCDAMQVQTTAHGLIVQHVLEISDSQAHGSRSKAAGNVVEFPVFTAS